MGSTCVVRGAPMRYFVLLSFPVLESSQCLWIRDSEAWTFSTELSFSVIKCSAFTKPCNCIPCILLSRVSPSCIYLVGTHISLFCLLAYRLPRQPSALPSLRACQSLHSSTLLQAHWRQDDGLDVKRPFLTENFTKITKMCI